MPNTQQSTRFVVGKDFVVAESLNKKHTILNEWDASFSLGE